MSTENRSNDEELRALCDAATPGPWAVDETPGFEHHVRTGGTSCAIPSTGEPIADAALDADAQFIAAARTAVPSLLARIAAVEAENERLRLAQFEPLGDNHHNAAACPYCSPGAALAAPLTPTGPTTGALARLLAKHQLAEVLPGGVACTCGAEVAALNPPLDDGTIKGEPLALAMHQMQQIESAPARCGRCAWCRGDHTPRRRGYELVCPHGFGCCQNCAHCQGGPATPEPTEETPPRCEHGEAGTHVYGKVVSAQDAHWRPHFCPGPGGADPKETRP